MNDRSFESSANSVYARVHVYCSREYDVLSIFSYTVVSSGVAYKFLFIYSHRLSVIEANEAVAYPVFGHAVEL